MAVWQRPKFPPPNGLEVDQKPRSQAMEFVRPAASTVRNAILNARPESDITLQRSHCRDDGREPAEEGLHCTISGATPLGLLEPSRISKTDIKTSVKLGQSWQASTGTLHIPNPQSPPPAPTRWCKSTQQRCSLHRMPPHAGDKGLLFYSIPGTSSFSELAVFFPQRIDLVYQSLFNNLS